MSVKKYFNIQTLFMFVTVLLNVLCPSAQAEEVFKRDQLKCGSCSEELVLFLTKNIQATLAQSKNAGFSFKPRKLSIEITAMAPENLEREGSMDIDHMRVQMKIGEPDINLAAIVIHELGHWLLNEELQANPQNYPIKVVKVQKILQRYLALTTSGQSETQEERKEIRELLKDQDFMGAMILMSYHELFADIVAVDSFSDLSINEVANSSISNKPEGRDFAKFYDPSKWVISEDHKRFSPVRSRIGTLIKNDDPKAKPYPMLGLLMKALGQEIDETKNLGREMTPTEANFLVFDYLNL